MRYQRLIAGMAASCVLAASACVSFPVPKAEGDVNGDCQTNILDMQIIADALLNGALPLKSADINGDGRIDVLDFQLLVRETSRPVSENSNHPSNLLETYVGVVPARFTIDKPDTKKIELIVTEHEIAHSHVRYETVLSPLLPARDPAVRGPSPHSPPLAA